MGLFDKLKETGKNLGNKVKTDLKIAEIEANIDKEIELTDEEIALYEDVKGVSIAEAKQEILSRFKPTIKAKGLYVDERNEKFSFNKKGDPAYDFNQLVTYELIEDGDTIATTTTKKQGAVSLKRAAVGSVFGPVGTIVGGLSGKRKEKSKHKLNEYITELSIKITLDNTGKGIHTIKFIEENTKRNGAVHKGAQQQAKDVATLLDFIAKQITEPEVNEIIEELPQPSTAEQLKELKELVDEGILTEEEFNAKKTQLLDL